MKVVVGLLSIALLGVLGWNWSLEERMSSANGTDATPHPVSDLRERYDAGLNVMNQVIKDLEALKSTLAFAELARSISDLSNPLNYKLFRAHLEEIQRNLDGKKNEGMRQIAEFASASNPILSIVNAVVGLFSSKFEKEKRKEIYREILAVAELTTHFQRDLVKFDASIRDLDLKVGLLLDENKQFHDQYTDIIGFDGDHQEYSNLPKIGPTSFNEARDEFFKVLADENDPMRAVRSIEYYLMQLLRHTHDYHSLLLEIKMVLARVEETVDRFDERVKSEPDLIESAKYLVAAARSRLSSCQKAFGQAYQYQIPEELLLKTQRAYWALP